MAIAGAERIFELLDEEVEEDEGTITLVRAKKDGDTLTECAERTGHWAWKVPQADGSVQLVEMRGDVKFHDVIFESTGNPKLVTLLNNLREQIYRYRVEYIKNPDNYPILIAEHNAIAEGLKNRDKEAATLAMHKHVKNQAVAVKSVIQCQDETESE